MSNNSDANVESQKLGVNAMKLLVLADKLSLKTLKRVCLRRIDTISFGREIAKNIDLRAKLSQKTRQLLDEKLMTTAANYSSRKRKLSGSTDDDSFSDSS